ncbi:hypothetical protein QBC38DRAFT_514777 [Podospora fimiseda]|uniref:Ankyrin repeat protein n=1 Tax=Podospora fimiseda TaxID=252190 RepID=A0AAN7BJN2_9PEZI|nr:hypothetical protein QBC38DRAFT_514777 [Podospora fimiseda]
MYATLDPVTILAKAFPQDALKWGIFFGQPTFIEKALERGARINRATKSFKLFNNQRSHPLITNGLYKATSWQSSFNKRVTPLIFALMLNQPNIGVAPRSWCGFEPGYAACFGRLSILKILINHGANMTDIVRSAGTEEETSVYKEGDKSDDSEAEVPMITHDGDGPGKHSMFHLVARHGHLDMLNLLVQQPGADPEANKTFVDSVQSQDFTPLVEVLKLTSTHPELVEPLIKSLKRIRTINNFEPSFRLDSDYRRRFIAPAYRSCPELIFEPKFLSSSLPVEYRSFEEWESHRRLAVDL